MYNLFMYISVCIIIIKIISVTMLNSLKVTNNIKFFQKKHLFLLTGNFYLFLRNFLI